MKYKKNLFLNHPINGCATKIKAAKLEDGMVVELYNGLLFYIDEVELEFKNNKVSKLYSDDDAEVLPEHLKVTIYSIIDMYPEYECEWNFISKIPGDLEVFVFDVTPITH